MKDLNAVVMKTIINSQYNRTEKVKCDLPKYQEKYFY